MWLNLLLICIAAITWGTTGATMILLSKVVSVNPLVVGFYRVAIAAPFLLLVANRRTKSSLKCYSRRELRIYLLLGACLAGYQLCYFSAVSLSGVAVSTLVAICSSPLIIAILATQYLGEKLTASIYTSLGLGLLGTGLLVANPQAAPHYKVEFFVGLALALLAGFCYAVYAVVAKASLTKLESLQVTAYSFTASAFFLTPVLMLQSLSVKTWLTSLPFLLYLGLIPTALAYALYMRALSGTSATIAGIAVLLEPLTATLLGIFLFQEPIGTMGILGASLLLIAIILLIKKKN